MVIGSLVKAAEEGALGEVRQRSSVVVYDETRFQCSECGLDRTTKVELSDEVENQRSSTCRKKLDWQLDGGVVEATARYGIWESFGEKSKSALINDAPTMQDMAVRSRAPAF